jgi:hypothetical protein
MRINMSMRLLPLLKATKLVRFSSIHSTETNRGRRSLSALFLRLYLPEMAPPKCLRKNTGFVSEWNAFAHSN